MFSDAERALVIYRLLWKCILRNWFSLFFSLYVDNSESIAICIHTHRELYPLGRRNNMAHLIIIAKLLSNKSYESIDLSDDNHQQ